MPTSTNLRYHTGGTLRWQAPELLSGEGAKITEKTDVYAFAMTCVEILTKGKLPWHLLKDDDLVRQVVLGMSASHNSVSRTHVAHARALYVAKRVRPDLPLDMLQSWLPELPHLIRLCCHCHAEKRPSFKTINGDMKTLCARVASDREHSPTSQQDAENESMRSGNSLQMHHEHRFDRG